MLLFDIMVGKKFFLKVMEKFIKVRDDVLYSGE